MKRARQARRLVAPCLVIAAAAFQGACWSDTEWAREKFASRNTCPEERVTATLRKDLKAVDLAFRAEPPPPAVAADPERLKLWNEKQARAAAEWDGKRVVQVRGCGREEFAICGQLRVSVGATRYGCSNAHYPPREGTGADAGVSRPR